MIRARTDAAPRARASPHRSSDRGPRIESSAAADRIFEGRLQGMRVLVTRPQPSADALAESLGQEGASAICVPAIEIVPLREAAIDVFSPAPDEPAIFTSVPAVEFFFAQTFSAPPKEALMRLPRAVFAIGLATAAALKERGVTEVLLPPRGGFDSEGLLAAPALAARYIRRRRVWIVKGEGGRRLLGDTLSRRGGIVFEICLYRRRAPAGLASALDDLGHRGAFASIDAITVASVATFDYLLAATDRARAWLEDIPLVAAGERVASAIRSQRFERVVAAADASHAAFVEALVAIRHSTGDEGFERRCGGGK
ncbi:uroporphyrinogen-III synthase [Thioalkalivibrio sp. HK1]|uniref:uroporphyrinogen-III synthase n=1 Tax=Thioalkalivibrio sp. HK1 TaxID=1469245 RepID=UPI00046EDBAF|nr:uroporphyrinogen-III synthase [Thioalkalivibrio sp. HK1]